MDGILPSSLGGRSPFSLFLSDGVRTHPFSERTTALQAHYASPEIQISDESDAVARKVQEQGQKLSQGTVLISSEVS